MHKLSSHLRRVPATATETAVAVFDVTTAVGVVRTAGGGCAGPPAVLKGGLCKEKKYLSPYTGKLLYFFTVVIASGIDQ